MILVPLCISAVINLNSYPVDIGDARQDCFDVRYIDDEEKLYTILFRTGDKLKIFGALDANNGQASSNNNFTFDADFFIDNTTSVTSST